MAEDGDCFFRAVVHQLHASDKEHTNDLVTALRANCVEHLKQNKSHYEQFIEDFCGTIASLRKKDNGTYREWI